MAGAVMLAALLAAHPAPPPAAPPQLSVTAVYEARMLMLKLADLRTDQVVLPGSFRSGARLTTMGGLGVIKPSVLLVQSNGGMAGGLAAPGVFIQTEKNGQKRRVVRYAPNQPPDPLTHLLRAALRPGAGSPCIGTVPVFDGRQRYDLTLAPTGGAAAARFGLTRPVACRLGFRPLSGFAGGPPRQSPFLRGDPVASFAYAPKGDVWVMTDVAVPTLLGTGHVALTALRIDGARPAFAKAAPAPAPPRRPATKPRHRGR